MLVWLMNKTDVQGFMGKHFQKVKQECRTEDLIETKTAEFHGYADARDLRNVYAGTKQIFGFLLAADNAAS